MGRVAELVYARDSKSRGAILESSNLSSPTIIKLFDETRTYLEENPQ